MAEIMSVMVLLNNLKQLLAQVDDDNHRRLRDQILWFYEQLEIMFGFALIYYSQGKSSSHDHRSSDDYELITKVVGMIRDFSLESGDVLVDTFVIAKHTSTNSPTPMICSLTEQINSIVGFITMINSDDQSYRNRCKRAIEESMQGLSRRRRLVAEEDKAVGLTNNYERLVERMTDDRVKKPQLNVIAIMGEGGTGKSTLVKKVYNHDFFKESFECRGWMLVSKKYLLRNLLLMVLSDIMVITQEINEMEEWELKNLLKSQLTNRRYLIVIDDLWDTKAWDELKDLFPINSNESQILVTTRFPVVASYASTRGGKNSIQLEGKHYKLPRQQIYDYEFLRLYEELRGNDHEYDCFELMSLSDIDSWEFFHKTIFGKEKFPFRLEDHGRSIVKRCCGRPIVIVVVACILKASKINYSRWSNIVSRINWKLDSPDDSQLDILTLCFHYLPQHLKACFLYLCVFPEDFEIYVEQLIQLWIAEGLIGLPAKHSSRSMEDAARHYLDELISRNLIQVKKKSSTGHAKSCRIHDLLRDLCIRLSKEERFLEVHTGGAAGGGGGDHIKQPQRLSILSDDCREYVSNSNTSSTCSHVRSFSCYSEDTGSFSEENWESIFKHFPLLRVLNLGEREARILPETIGELFHLRYLRVKPAKNIRVPKSIFNLLNLQTIDLRKASLPELPEEIWKMQQLRHLYLNGRNKLPKAKSEDCLPNLLTLSYVSIDFADEIHITEKAPNLRKLGLCDYQCLDESEQEATFNLQHIQSLKFSMRCVFEEPIKLPESITKITVKGAQLQPNVIELFEKLSNLRILKLVHTNFENDELVFGEDSFPQLQLLKFENSNIVRWEMKEGAMPKLRRLVLSSCSQLPELPHKLWKWNWSIIQEFELFWPSTELANKVAEDLKKSRGIKLLIYPPRSTA